MRYLQAEDILLIHSILIEETGGMHGVRDHAGLLSVPALAAQTAFHKELYPTVFEKAAVYARGIVMDHPFLDGNKRTGITTAALFLEENGYIFIAPKDVLHVFAVSITMKRLTIPVIADWFKKYTKKKDA